MKTQSNILWSGNHLGGKLMIFYDFKNKNNIYFDLFFSYSNHSLVGNILYKKNTNISTIITDILDKINSQCIEDAIEHKKQGLKHGTLTIH